MDLFEFLVEGAVLSGLYYFATKEGIKIGKNSVNEKIKEDEITELRRQVYEMKKKTS